MSMGTSFVIKGDIIYSETKDRVTVMPEAYLICRNGRSDGVFPTLPDSCQNLTLLDYTGSLIVPGLVDLHTHAPQYAFMGLGMDNELIDWLEGIAFPEERNYSDLRYAQVAYQIFADDLRKSFTTRACIFGTVHPEATLLLMDQLEATGLNCSVGKVNMDRNCPDTLREDTEHSLLATEEWLSQAAGRYHNTMPILTPRFLPSCTPQLLSGLSKLAVRYGLPVQSHLSENLSEIAWVRELCPESSGYADAYRAVGLLGGDVRTVMAHCVHLTMEEAELLREQDVYVAHCPTSNTNLSSGVAPVRSFLDRGLSVGLGTDVAGGDSLSLFQVMAEAVKASKLRWRLLDQTVGAISVDEAFYLGTKGGGGFFGKVGSFEPGYELDALVLNDSTLRHPHTLTLRERFERLIYRWEGVTLTAKYCRGKPVELKSASSYLSKQGTGS